MAEVVPIDALPLAWMRKLKEMRERYEDEDPAWAGDHRLSLSYLQRARRWARANSPDLLRAEKHPSVVLNVFANRTVVTSALRIAPWATTKRGRLLHRPKWARVHWIATDWRDPGCSYEILYVEVRTWCGRTEPMYPVPFPLGAPSREPCERCEERDGGQRMPPPGRPRSGSLLRLPAD